MVRQDVCSREIRRESVTRHEAEKGGDAAGAYKSVMDNDGQEPLRISIFDKAPTETEAEERAVENYSRMD